MDMRSGIDRGRPAVASAQSHATDTILWYHRAFCRAALPVRTLRGAWQRSLGDATIRIEPSPAGHAMPAGRVFRLVLLHVLDAALRGGAPVVELGASAVEAAERIGNGVEPRALADQVERMLAARITVACEGGAEQALFDARGRPRATGSPWRSSIRLNGSFQASLAEHAVPLDRRIVERLHESLTAFDAYAWTRSALHGRDRAATVTASWTELRDRFGSSTQDAAAFRAAFEAALREVFEADRSVVLAVDDDGVSLRHASEDDDTAAPAPVAEPAPAASAPAAPEVPAARPAYPPGPRGQEAEDPADRIAEDTINLRSHLTGLSQVIWLRRGYGEDSALVGVTPSARFDPDWLTVMAVEPIVMEVSGSLGRQEAGRIAAWIMANRDLIDDFWAGEVTSHAEIARRIRKVPAGGWR